MTLWSGAIKHNRIPWQILLQYQNKIIKIVINMSRQQHHSCVPTTDASWQPYQKPMAHFCDTWQRKSTDPSLKTTFHVKYVTKVDSINFVQGQYCFTLYYFVWLILFSVALRICNFRDVLQHTIDRCTYKYK